MVDNKQIPYRKKLPPKATKQLGSGGPRDMQRRQGIGMPATINMPKVDMGDLKAILLNNKELREELTANIHKEMEKVRGVVESSKSIEGIGLPFDVVEQKIKEAVEQTEKNVRERYESGLGNLNSQLNASKARVKELNNRLVERKQEINELKKQVLNREEKLEEKNRLINTLREQQNKEIGELKTKIMDLISKIKSGKITSDNYDKARPILDDKIFIDPIEKSTEPKLDSHIDIKEDKISKTDVGRNINTDLDKLRNLLKL